MRSCVSIYTDDAGEQNIMWTNLLHLLLTTSVFTFCGSRFLSHEMTCLMFTEHVDVTAVHHISISIYPVNNPAPLTLLLSVFLCEPITPSLLYPSLPWRPLRGRFYSVWITCPSWRWACWWGANLFPPVEPWFKALRSTRFWVIVSPVVMNQGSGRHHAACRQRRGVGVLRDATAGQLHSDSSPPQW